MLPVIVDYALVSDINCWFYIENNEFNYKIIQRENLPELTFDIKNFTSTKNTSNLWNESNTIKY